MNRQQRREFAKHAKRGSKRAVERELKRRGDAKWSEACMFDQHDRCFPGTPCGCSHHERPVQDEKGETVEGAHVRDSGLYVARNPGIRIARPRGGSGVAP